VEKRFLLFPNLIVKTLTHKHVILQNCKRVFAQTRKRVLA